MSGGEAFTVQTGVDKLVSYLKGRGQVLLNDVAKELDVDIKTVEMWANFLSEEKLVEIEYKFTKPYLSLVGDKSSEDSIQGIKKSFEDEHSDKSKDFKEYKWKNQVLAVLEKKRDFFIKEANKRNIQEPEKVWEEYKKRVLSI